jgi:hypothetical protein
VAIAASLGCAGTHPAGTGALRILDAPALDPALRARLEAEGDRARAARLWPPGGLLDLLAQNGYLQGSVCRESDSLWMVEPRAPVDSIRLAWDARGWAQETRGLIPVRSLPAREGGFAPRLESTAILVLQRCADAGHPLASIRMTDATLDAAPELRLRLDPGPVVHVTGVVFQGARVTRGSHLKRVIGWDGPETYRGRRWDEARDALYATGLFQTVDGPDVLTGAEAGHALLDSLAAPLLFRLREREINRFRGLAGYADRPGKGGGTLSGFIDLTLGNLFGTGRAIHALWEGLGQGRSRIELAWHEPYVWKFPLAADLSLRHFQEDTLFAETSWGADLAWRPTADWRVALGYGGTRLVLGGDLDREQQRATSRFRIDRHTAAYDPWAGDWALQAEATRAQGGVSLRSARLALSEQLTRRWWGLWMEQQAGLLVGPDSLLRSDLLRIGGAATLRGYLEGERLGRSFVLQRTEVGRRLDRRGARTYLLADAGWIEEWQPAAGGLYGLAGRRRFLSAIGAGLQLPSSAGWVRLEFAVPRGAGLGQARIHLGLDGAF